MEHPPLSPISQLLQTLGITREDLEKRSDQMRQFLTAENSPTLRVTEVEKSHKSHKSSDSWSKPKSSSSTTSFSRSRSSANLTRDTTPPTTPMKPAPTETSGALRHYDSMEAVIERQRRQSRREKRERRERERDSMARSAVPQPSSPTPSNTSHSNHTAQPTAQGRGPRRVSFSESIETTNNMLPTTESSTVPPVTPQRSKYYREHTVLSASQTIVHMASVPVKTEALTPTRCPSPSAPASPSKSNAPPAQVYYAPYPHYLPYSLLPPMFPTATAGPSTLPVTPQPHRTLAAKRKAAFKSPLPPSSPPPASSPVATPRAINLVSSPGPSAPLPDEGDYDKLPFRLPPGPYSPTKPDASYAALIGQAILSSSERKLTLQEIYDYITIVYPHFKRGEQTWMNSIRHVLSTTVCFRKVVRDRSQGRTQWTIYDEDLDCFKGGGFRKSLCKAYANGNAGKEKAPGSRGKGRGKKRADNDDSSIDPRKAKKARLDHDPLPALQTELGHQPSLAHPIFPPTRPTPHHQPYYETCLRTQPLPGDIIFPPIPTDVAYTRISIPASSPLAPSSTFEEHASDPPLSSTPPPKSDREDLPTSSSSSVPDLVHNSSSSNSSPTLATSDVDGGSQSTNSAIILGLDQPTSDDDEAEIRALENSFLVPSKDWASDSPGTPPRKRARSPELTYPDQNLKSSIKFDEKSSNKKMTFPPFPTSPTLDRKTESRLPRSTVTYDRRSISPTPTTPPRTSRQLPTSSVRTPLSSKGINPAALQTDAEDDDLGKRRNDRTPRKRVTSSGYNGPAPVTPRRLIFPTNQNDSPFRTPSGIFGTSPLRTPGSRAIFDPHDPGALLDDELNRLGNGPGDSPAGIFGKGRGSLLYDSPGLSTSPGRWW